MNTSVFFGFYSIIDKHDTLGTKKNVCWKEEYCCNLIDYLKNFLKVSSHQNMQQKGPNFLLVSVLKNENMHGNYYNYKNFNEKKNLAPCDQAPK